MCLHLSFLCKIQYLQYFGVPPICKIHTICPLYLTIFFIKVIKILERETMVDVVLKNLVLQRQIVLFVLRISFGLLLAIARRTKSVYNSLYDF